MSGNTEQTAETPQRPFFNAFHVRNQAARILAMEDPQRAHQARDRLMRRIIQAVADGETRSPRRCCEAFQEAFGSE